jgi:transcriptional regulator with XRE-family HTH domain
MGRSHRPRPARLAAKLKRIRQSFDLTQAQMVERLNQKGLYPGHIAEYERGKREPPYPTLLKYARLANISTDMLIDDEMDLPERLPIAARRRVSHVTTK